MNKKDNIINFLKFKEFPDSNISGKMIVNPYWLEHLLNLFFQGYVCEVLEEIINTEINNCNSIESWVYGIIGKELKEIKLFPNKNSGRNFISIEKNGEYMEGAN